MKINAEFKNVLWLILDKVLLLLLNIFIGVKVAFHYGPAEYGLFEYAVSIETIICILLTLVDPRVVKKKYNSLRNDLSIIRSVTITKLALSIMVLIFGVVFLFFIKNENRQFRVIFSLLLINTFLINITFGHENYFEYHLKSKIPVLSNNASKVASLVFQLFSMALGYPVFFIAVALLAGNAIRILIVLYLFRKEFGTFGFITEIHDNKNAIGIIKESAPLAIAAAASIIYMKTDQLMLGMMMGKSEVGIYSFAVKLVTVTGILIQPIQVTLFPRMKNLYLKDRKKYFEYYETLTGIITLSCLFIFLFIWLLPNQLFLYIIAESYAQSITIFKVLIIGIFFMYVAIFRSSHYTIIGETRVMAISQILSCFLNIALNILLISRYGLLGASLATITTQFLSLILFDFFIPNGKRVSLIELHSIFYSLYPPIILKRLHRNIN